MYVSAVVVSLKIAVAAGEERTGISLAVRTVRTTAVFGTVARTDSQSVTNTQLSVIALGPRPLGGPPTTRAAVLPNGEFALGRLPPGEYSLIARLVASGAAEGITGPGFGDIFWASTGFTVRGEDAIKLDLLLAPGAASKDD